MSIYIAPFDYNNSILPEEFIKENSLVVIFYKMGNEDLGFRVDSKSEAILYMVSENSIWFDIINNKIGLITKEVFTEKVYAPRGLIAFNCDFIEEEIEKEKEYSITEKKNNILKRNNKPLLSAYPSVFSNLYNPKINKYNTQNISELITKKVDFAIVDRADSGYNLITQTNSKFIERLKQVCLNLNEPVFWVDNESLIPPW